MEPCDDIEVLAAYQEGRLDPARRGAAETHAAACPACQGFLLRLGKAREEPDRGVWLWRAAAGLLIAAAGLAWVSHDPGRNPMADIPPVVRSGFPEGALGSPAEPRSYLFPGVDLVTEPGTMASASDRTIRLESGWAWLAVPPGQAPVILQLFEGSLGLEAGEVAVRRSRPAPAAQGFLLAPAMAEEASLAEIWVLGGEVLLTRGGSRRTLRGGAKASCEGGVWKEAAIPPEEAQDLALRRARVVAALKGRDLPVRGGHLAAPDTFRWVVTLTGRQPSAELGLTLDLRGLRRQWVLGIAADPPRPEQVVEVVWDGRRLVGRLDGRVMISGSKEELGAALPPTDRQPWEVSAWGAAVTVARSVLVEGGS